MKQIHIDEINESHIKNLIDEIKYIMEVYDLDWDKAFGVYKEACRQYELFEDRIKENNITEEEIGSGDFTYYPIRHIN